MNDQDNPPDDETSKQEKTLQISTWNDIQLGPDESIILISPTGDLEAVALSMKNGNKEQVSLWLEDNTIDRPTEEQVNKWERSPTQKFCWIKVEPYTLIKVL